LLWCPYFFELCFGTQRRATAGFAFIIAGAIGNALDRIRFGAVIDLFNASKAWVHFDLQRCRCFN
jgi:lipoprotein signal peptidase